MINWDNYFDKIFILSYVYNTERREEISLELSRVGINNYEFYLNVDNDLIQLNDRYDKKQWYVVNGYYHIFKICKAFNYNRILIIEDDMVFLKDLNTIESYLNLYLESNADVFCFGGCMGINDNFIFYCGCIGVTQNGIDYLIDSIELNKISIDQYYILDKYSQFTLYFDGSDIPVIINFPESFYNMSITGLPKYNLLPLCIERIPSFEGYYLMNLQYNIENKNLYNI